jgi:hypothetical protein
MAMLQQLPTTWPGVFWNSVAGSERFMNYTRGILSGVAAIFIAEFVFVWPFLKGTKATGLALFAASPLSPRFWIVGILLFGLFFAASRLHSKLLRLPLFWTVLNSYPCDSVVPDV